MSDDIEELRKRLESAENAIRWIGSALCTIVCNLYIFFLKGEERESYIDYWKEKIEAVIKNLAGRGQSKPRKVSTLSNTINSLFTEKLNEQEMKSFINTLKSKKYITVDQDKVSYHFQKGEIDDFKK